MKNRTFISFAALALAAFAYSPAKAGFEWRPPPQSQPRTSLVRPAPAATPKVQAETMPAPAPVPLAPVTAAPLSETVPPSSPDKIIWKTGTASVPPAGAPEIVWATPPIETDARIIEGFANHISLALALEQIVPDSYQLSYDPDVDLGQRVSWQGGRPWTAVLDDLLAPLDLRARKVGATVVRIESRAAAVAGGAAKPLSPVSSSATDMPEDNELPAVVKAMGRSATPQQASRPQPVSLLEEEETIRAVTNFVDLPERQDADIPDISVLEEPEDGAPVPVPVVPASPQPVKTSVVADAAPVVLATTADAARTSGPSWRAQEGEMLRAVLEDWTHRAGIELFWGMDYDYRLNETIQVSGDFPQAARQLLDYFRSIEPRPYGELHDPQDGSTPVLVIRAYN